MSSSSDDDDDDDDDGSNKEKKATVPSPPLAFQYKYKLNQALVLPSTQRHQTALIQEGTAKWEPPGDIRYCLFVGIGPKDVNYEKQRKHVLYQMEPGYPFPETVIHGTDHIKRKRSSPEYLAYMDQWSSAYETSTEDWDIRPVVFEEDKQDSNR